MSRFKRDGEEDVEVRASKRLRGEIVEEPIPATDSEIPIEAEVPMVTEQTAAEVSAVIDADMPSHGQDIGAEVRAPGPEVPEELHTTEVPVGVAVAEAHEATPDGLRVEMSATEVHVEASGTAVPVAEHPVAPTDVPTTQQTLMAQNHGLVPPPTEVEHERQNVRMITDAEAAIAVAPRAPRMIGGSGGPDDLWRQRFKELEAFKDEYGHCNVPCTYALNKNLAKWIVVQRAERKRFLQNQKSSINQDMINQLDALGFVWAPFEQAWEMRFSELAQYKEKYNTCAVPKGWGEGKQLAQWVADQRKQRKKKITGKKACITDERIARLEELGLEWTGKGHTAWQSRLGELKEYKEKNSQCNVPKAWPENKQLAKWVNKQRTEYKKKSDGHKSSMTDERIAELEAIGFVWSLKKRASFEQRFAELTEYHKQHGDCKVPSGRAEYKQLSSWVSKQRAERKKMLAGESSSMTPERVEKLDKLGFVWQRPRVNADTAVAAEVSVPAPAIDPATVQVAPEPVLSTEEVAGAPESELPEVVDPVVEATPADAGLPQVTEVSEVAAQ
eukprot:m.382558 g.382558  ORF g.382558 m.382558 type:complete len:558 (-) comp20973_c0_seq1:1188-2861(-)